MVLSLIDRRIGSRLPQPARHRLSQLEAQFGPAPSTSDAWRNYPSGDGDSRQPVASSDDEWMAAIENYDRSPSHDLTRDQAPTAQSPAWDGLPEALEAAARAEPARFARLVTTRFGSGLHHHHHHHHHRCIVAILRAATETTDELPAEDLSAIADMADAVSQWRLPELNRPLCSLLNKLAHIDLSEDILDWVATVATSAVDPTQMTDAVDDDEVSTDGLNSDRGAAAHTIAGLLGPAEYRTPRLSRLLPAITNVAADAAGQVRIWAPTLLTQVHAADQDMAADLTRTWLSLADDAQLGAPYLHWLTWRLLRTSPDLGLALIERMFDSAEPPRRRRGGMVVAAAILGIQSTDPRVEGQLADLFERSLAAVAPRRGVADALAGNVNDLRQASPATGDTPRLDQALLVRLMDDDDVEVRTAAIAFTHHLTGTLTRHRQLLTALGPTRAFKEHPDPIFHALHQVGGQLPIDASLSLCEHWRSAMTAGETSSRAKRSSRARRPPRTRRVAGYARVGVTSSRPPGPVRAACRPGPGPRSSCP